MRKMCLIYYGVTFILLASGCSSVRVKTDLVPETDAKLKSPAGMFYIAGVEYGCDYGDDLPASEAVKAFATDYGNKLLRLLRKECSARYPLLFLDQENSAIPLFVTVKEVFDYNQSKYLTWGLCTLLITPLVLPAPIDTDRDLTVSAGVWNGAGAHGSVAVLKKFRREERGWLTVLTPLGLIPVSGTTDFPVESTAFVSGNHFRFFDEMPQISQQVATALAKIITSKEPEFWTAPPSRSQQPGYAPTTPATTPAILPPPSEPITPF